MSRPSSVYQWLSPRGVMAQSSILTLETESPVMVMLLMIHGRYYKEVDTYNIQYNIGATTKRQSTALFIKKNGVEQL